MRRSKSNPAKYARNYRSISQRRMTAAENNNDLTEDEERKEIQRLQKLLRDSEDHIKQGTPTVMAATTTTTATSPSGRKRKHANDDGGGGECEETTAKVADDEGPTRSILSAELLDEISVGNNAAYYYGNDTTTTTSNDHENPLVILPGNKKKKKQNKSSSSQVVMLTPEEIREAKKQHKKTQKKLQQLQQRAEQKKKRTELYAKLQESSLSQQEMKLLSSSSTLGKKLSKKEILKQLLQKERAGITLTKEERNILYKEKKVDGDGGDADDDACGGDQDKEGKMGSKKNGDIRKGSSTIRPTTTSSTVTNTKQKAKKTKSKSKEKSDVVESARIEREDYVVPGNEVAPGAKSGTQREGEESEDNGSDNNDEDNEGSTFDEESSASNESMGVCEITKHGGGDNEVQESKTPASSKKTGGANTHNATHNPAAPVSFAAQMMASLSKLKTQTEEQKAAAETAKKQKEASGDGSFKIPEPPRKRYVPTEPAVLRSAAALGLQPHVEKRHRTTRVIEIRRPADVEKARYELPVSQMEYEVMDAIRNHDVTIICGETGSGKSTQIPQFLYQAGMTFGGGRQQKQQKEFMIGVTQPRRIAAVSTAKRVCYEMGHGNGQSIPNHNKRGSCVAYQTRYETAGLGSETKIKFMTDGILLQEIQSDLLLRKYSVICLDEAHERNLNTDVLIGLLSKSIPLRRQAALEDPANMAPLKLVIMSATLKVQDFTENDKLFSPTSTLKPSLVTIPGRTFPVTIHHSKVTELDEYEELAFQKICKIHRKLPQGGILVFLTGKQEIIRMVNRLRRAFALKSTTQKDGADSDYHDVSPPEDVEEDVAIRDLDDEELDGDLFRSGDKDEDENGNERLDMNDTVNGEGGPQPAHILPLYSLLSSEDQAKVFAPVPEGHRLIVVATNIAETSITIPDISYVVDCGRQKCRNYNAGTAVVSYDVMWISKAAADQRAGRAGRCGPGHVYRLYSSTMYSRHMDPFALPEVLIRPLEDVALSMKAMKISNIANFPFPTPPPSGQLEPALRLLSNIGCLDLSGVEDNVGDGEITRLGKAVANLPIGVRYAKILLVAAQAGVLDYAIATVAALSESNPFTHQAEIKPDNREGDEEDEDDGKRNVESAGDKRRRWTHRGGDVLAVTIAVGAYTYAGQGLRDKNEQRRACIKFCLENGLNHNILERIQKMRSHLCRLARARLRHAKESSMAAMTGGFIGTMKPPNISQERLLRQAVASGFLDNIAMLAPLGSIPGEHPFSLRTAYISCSSRRKEPLFIDRNSVLYSRDSRLLPQWICFDSLLRKTLKDGTPIAVMKNITPIDVSWLGTIATGSQLLQLGEPQLTPLPVYDSKCDAILCSVTTKFGYHGWEIPSVKLKMDDALKRSSRTSTHLTAEDKFRWFARFLMEGKVIQELQDVTALLNENPSIITNRSSHKKKVVLVVSALSNAGVDNAYTLQKHWAEIDDKFLFKLLKHWVNAENVSGFKSKWIAAVRQSVLRWRKNQINTTRLN